MVEAGGLELIKSVIYLKHTSGVLGSKELTKLIKAISFLFHFICYVGLSYSVSGIIFKAHLESSLVEAMEAFTDVIKLVEAISFLFHFICYVG